MKLYLATDSNFLNNEIDCHMEDDPKKYSVGDIIHYKGRCYEWIDFYAKIDKILTKGLNITRLSKVEVFDNIYFYDMNITMKGLTRRPFKLLKSP